MARQHRLDEASLLESYIRGHIPGRNHSDALVGVLTRIAKQAMTLCLKASCSGWEVSSAR